MVTIRRVVKYLTAAVFVILFAPISVLAIGQVSSPIVVDNALRGQVYREAISLFNSSDSEEVFILTAKGQPAGWMAFYDINGTEPIENITIPGNSKSQAIVAFTIPQAAANGLYEGAVVFSLKPKDEVKARVSQQLSRKVAITVTDVQEISGNVLIRAKSTAIAAGTPFEVTASCFNTGNVTIKPTIELDVVPEGGKSIFDVIFPYPKSGFGILPGQTEEIAAQWPTASQAVGKYTARATVVLGDSTTDQVFEFEILPSSGVAAMANAGSVVKNNLDIFWLAVGSIVVLAVAVVEVIKRRRRAV